MSTWGENAKYVLDALTRHSHMLERIETKMDAIHVDITQLKMKASIWGAVAGALVAGATAIIVGLVKKSL